MNYQRIYEAFIADRRGREADLIESGVYVERHHITPRGLGGGDEAENIDALTAGDHFFAHLCLAKVHGGWQWSAVWTMTKMASSRHDRAHLFTRRRWVEKARIESSKAKSENTKRLHAEHHWGNVCRTPEANEKRSKTMREHFNSEEGKAHKAAWTAVVHSPEMIAKRAETTRQQYASGARDADKKRIAEQAKAQASDPEWLATLPRGSGHAASKAVKCLNTEEVFETIGAAAKKFGMSGWSISNSAKRNKAARNGLSFVFV